MLLVLLTSSRLRLEASRELPSALLQLSHGAALTRGVGRFPAGGAVELAGLVKCSIEGVLALLAPLNAARSPRASLVGSRSLRASRSLGKLLHVVKPQMDVQGRLASLRLQPRRQRQDWMWPSCPTDLLDMASRVLLLGARPPCSRPLKPGLVDGGH
jgi:hypothetical protein